MALVLCTGADPSLVHTRSLILESVGHTVTTAFDEPAVVTACKRHPFDVAIISQDSPRHLKTKLLALIRKNCPYARVLEVYLPNPGILLSGADDWAQSPVRPTELLKRVSFLSREGQRTVIKNSPSLTTSVVAIAAR